MCSCKFVSTSFTKLIKFYLLRSCALFKLMSLLYHFGLHTVFFSRSLAGPTHLVYCYHNIICEALDFVCDAPVRPNEEPIPRTNPPKPATPLHLWRFPEDISVTTSSDQCSNQFCDLLPNAFSGILIHNNTPTCTYRTC